MRIFLTRILFGRDEIFLKNIQRTRSCVCQIFLTVFFLFEIDFIVLCNNSTDTSIALTNVLDHEKLFSNRRSIQYNGGIAFLSRYIESNVKIHRKTQPTGMCIIFDAFQFRSIYSHNIYQIFFRFFSLVASALFGLQLIQIVLFYDRFLLKICASPVWKIV